MAMGSSAANPLDSCRFEEPLANLLNEQHRTVKEQLEQLRMKKTSAKLPQESERAKLRSEKPVQVLTLDAGERRRLQQQMQQVLLGKWHAGTREPHRDLPGLSPNPCSAVKLPGWP